MAKGQDYFQKHNINHIDYKDIATLKKFVNATGRIMPAKVTGTHANNQRSLTKAIKHARFMALMPYVIK
jgi:small subunit ribosomal protein S18